ncbi:MAG: NAD-dependent succinate-semialdehyde dehydrogenase [Alphaproteobacteria bacterium]|nr:NAD-dependent succinate-semialdehyde dehydrogenase [Alphaproteobacteria bacterium]
MSGERKAAGATGGRTLSEDVLKRVRDPGLFVQDAYIDGRWVEAEDGRRRTVIDAATDRPLGSVPSLGARETERAIDAAERAFPAWRALTAWARGDILNRWGDLMGTHKADLAAIMVLEQGKPLAEAEGEIDYARSFLHWFAEEGKRQYGEVIPTHLSGARLQAARQPIGVAAAITPWNFPSAMITRKAGAALAAGCPMIVRPAEETPFSATALAKLAEEAGVPAGVFQVVTGDPEPIAAALMDAKAVRALSFTGSTRVGKRLAEQAARTVKKVSLELGGHAPFLVFDDADLDRAVDGAVKAKMATTGQDCLAVNRILVQRPLYEAFCETFAAAIAAMKVGPGFEPGVALGPLMNAAAVEKCVAHVQDALAKGGRLLTGGGRHPAGALFFEPTAIAGLTPDMAIWREETFGPVAPIAPFEDEAEAVRLANDSDYGLAAYLYTEGLNRAHRVSEALDYGMVAVNTPKMTGPPVPFGGVKESGLGREGARHGLDDYTEIKYVCFGGAAA